MASARAVALLTAGLWMGCATRAPSLAIRFVADHNIPFGTRFAAIGGEPLGGISAIAYERSSGHWLALSDAPSDSRFYELAILYDGEALDVRPVAVTRLYDGNGEPFADNVLDPEGMVETPWGTVLISTEPDTRHEPVHQAQLLEFDADGRIRRRLELPEKFVVEGSPPQKGVRHNMGFESLTLSPDGGRLFVGGEMSLVQDGPEVTFERVVYCRIVEYAIAGTDIAPITEYAYPLGPVPRVKGLGEADLSTGLVELVALSDTRLLALERDFVRERAGAKRGVNRARIFVVDLEDASDVSAISSLDGGAGFIPVHKTLVLDLDDIVSQLSPEFRSLDNFEAMGLGPALAGRGQSLVVVSDDNFNNQQRSAFLLFSFEVGKP